jgi:hypothetical protein
MAHLTAQFEVHDWQEQPYQDLDHGSKLTRATVTRTYTGDLAADSTSESLMFYASDSEATIVGLERVVGTLANRRGSFVVESRSTFDGTEARGTWSVVDGSATDQLAGLSGRGTFSAQRGPNGTVELDYTLD